MSSQPATTAEPSPVVPPVRSGSWPLLFAVVAIVGAFMVAGFVVDVTLAGVRPINERPPAFGPADQLRTGLMILAAVVFVGGILLGGARGTTDPDAAAAPLPGGDRDRYALAWGLLAAQLAVTLIFVVSPPVFTYLSLEDGIVEWLSAILAFAAAGLLAVAGWRLWRRGPRADRKAAAMLLFASFVCLVLGGEEVSWFQRVLDIETPAGFQTNLQNEMNLHNFETNAIEVAYYFSSWAAFVALPFVRDWTPFIRRYRIVQIFAPSTLVLAMSAPLTAFNHDQWNQVPAQFALYATVLILVLYLVTSTSPRRRALIGASLAVCVVIQTLYLYFGHRLLRYWEITEYRELFIPLVMVIVAVHALRNVRARITSPTLTA